MLLWSIGIPISETALESTSPALLSVTRFAITGAVLLPFALRDARFRSVLFSRSTVLLALTGVALYYALSHTAIQLSTAGTIALAGALSPVITALLGRLLLKERIRPKTWVALILITAGVAGVATTNLSVDPGVLLFVVALTSYAIYTVLLRRSWSTAAPSAITLSAATSLWGTVLLLPWFLLDMSASGLQSPSWMGWVMIGILAVGVTAPAAALFAFGAERLPAVVTGTLTGIGPPLGYAIAMLFGEIPDPAKILGGLVAVLGVAISVVPLSRQKRQHRVSAIASDSRLTLFVGDATRKSPCAEIVSRVRRWHENLRHG